MSLLRLSDELTVRANQLSTTEFTSSENVKFEVLQKFLQQNFRDDFCKAQDYTFFQKHNQTALMCLCQFNEIQNGHYESLKLTITNPHSFIFIRFCKLVMFEITETGKKGFRNLGI